MVVAYVMCGIPGSGKTTTSKKIAEEYGLERFSFDEMHCFSLESFMQPALETLEKGKSIVLDTVNLRINVRKQVLQILSNIPCKKIVIYMNTPLKECLYRNANRETRLPDHVIESTYKSLQPPTLDEGWDEILYY